MPIRPENRTRYPKDWKAISTAIKERAHWRCECMGECESGIHGMWVRLGKWDPDMTDGRCPNEHGKASRFTGAKVVLTTAHLDHTPEHCEPDNLRAMCQGCHLNYDREHHAETRAMTLAAQALSSSVPRKEPR